MRHSVISDLVHDGLDLLTVAQISGTSVSSATTGTSVVTLQRGACPVSPLNQSLSDSPTAPPRCLEARSNGSLWKDFVERVAVSKTLSLSVSSPPSRTESRLVEIDPLRVFGCSERGPQSGH